MDFLIREPMPFNTTWYSHKFSGPGLRYELGLSIGNGHIVWAHAPFPCCAYPDLRIFRQGVKNCLKRGECVLTDGSYREPRCKTDPNGVNSKFSKTVRSSNETMNRGLKHFCVLQDRYNHNLQKHSLCFYVVANLTQLLIERGEPLFELYSSNRARPTLT